MKTISQSFIFAGIVLALLAGVFAFSAMTADAYGSSCGSCDAPDTGGGSIGGGGGGSTPPSVTPPVCDIDVDLDVVAVGEFYTIDWNVISASPVNVYINGDHVEKTGEATYDFLASTPELEFFNLTAENAGGTCSDRVEIRKKVVEEKKCELEITKSVDKHSATPGEELTYEIKVENIGTADCTGGGVKIEDVLDTNFEYVSNTYTSNLTEGYGSAPVYTASTRTIRFNGNTLTPGESGTIVLFGKVATPHTCGDFEVKNQAFATAFELDNFNDWVYSNVVKTNVDYDCEVPAPLCTSFTATPGTLPAAGGTVVLDWDLLNVATAVIDNGVGEVLANVGSNYGSVSGSQTTVVTQSTTFTLTATDVDGDKTTCKAPVTVPTDNPTPPQCPLVAKDGRTIVNFSGMKLRTDRTANDAVTAIQSAAFPVGEYDITLVSWDGYTNRVNASQPNEQWKLEFMNGSAVIAGSGIIGDLADNVIEATKIEQVNTDFTLATAATGVRAIHPFYPASSPNSLYPICAAIDEKPKEVVPPSCDMFTATPATITVGGTATLAWESTNAVQAFINNAIGAVDVDGTIEVSPLADTTYVLTLIGAEDNTVNCNVPVKVVDEPVMECVAFTASPSALPVGGGNTTLAWEVINAVSVSIDNGIGAVALTDTRVAAVTESTTYTLTATDADGDTVSCIAPVAVADPGVFTCEDNVSFSASDTSITRGQSSTLNWDVTDADSVSISGISATTFTGSQSVSPSSDTTYTLTATKSGFETISCPVKINVSTGGGGGGTPTPRCELEISDTRINAGDEITLTWDSTNARELTLTDNFGNTLVTTEDKLSRDKDDLFEGSIDLNPTRNTTYTLLVERGSRDRECEVKVEMDDDVVLLQVRDQAPLVSGISLTQVPYTGFEAGPIMTVLFYMLLITWALYITYVLVMPKAQLAMVPVKNSSLRTNEDLMQHAEQIRPDVFAAVSAAPVVEVPANLPVATTHVAMPVVAEIPDTNTIENQAHALQALISSDAARTIAAMTNESNQAEVLRKIVNDAKGQFPLEDGWVVINQSRLAQITDTTTTTVSPSPTGAGSLAEAIVTGNVVAAYNLVGTRPMIALADAAADLDAVYRIKKGADATVSDMLATETENLSEGKIAEMIAALTGALDGTYTDESSAVKMAIMKAVQIAG